MTNEEMACLFHETYEGLAPQFGYSTREASAVPWQEVPENNRRLMIAVASRVAAALEAEPLAEGWLYHLGYYGEHLAFAKFRDIKPVNYDTSDAIPVTITERREA